jgi:hypothetical protein
MDVRHALVKSLLTIFSMVLFNVLSLPSFALTQTESAKLPVTGFAVSVDGNTALIGAYVYVRTGDVWIEQAKLEASDSTYSFGNSVSIDGDTAVVTGAFGDDPEFAPGAAYVFVRAGDVWTEQAKLTSDSELWDAFGCAVAIDGDTIVVGANGDDDNENGIGAAHIFVRTDDVWTKQSKIVASDYPSFDRFGDSVSIDGDTVVIGAPHDGRNGWNAGAAYVFVRTGDVWTEQAKILASDGAAEDRFGLSVSVFGDTVIIGTPHRPESESAAGAAYVFVRTGDTWTEQTKLVASDSKIDDWFGNSVSVFGDTATIGAPHPGYPPIAPGAAYMFRRINDDWVEQAVLISSDGEEGDLFGWSVSHDNHTALIGTIRAGAAYVFTTSVTVNIDIKPSKKPENVINLKKGKNLKVAIVGTADFDALQVDPSTMKFGPSEACPIRYKGKDYNKDGFADLILIFRIEETGIACGDTVATLTGQTFPDPAINFAGSDTITVEPCP